jgi:hypothetical protein
MTDARFPDRWLSDRRLQRLTDGHFRAFITSLAWSVSNRTDGVIEPEDLALIPNFAVGAPQALVSAGLWSPLENGWRITEYAVTQTSRDQLTALENLRVREREKKARQRAAKKSATSTDAVVPGTVPRDVPPDNTGQARPGKDRPGEGDHLRLAAGGENLWRGAGPNPYDYEN